MMSDGGATLLLLAGLATATPEAGAADPRRDSPERREIVVDLAYVLGEIHALHRICAGPDDDTWRARMRRLMEVESPDTAYRQRLTAQFNAGFIDGSAANPTCVARTQAAERRAAEQGRTLSRRLAAQAF